MKKLVISLVSLVAIGAGAGNGFERVWVDYSHAGELSQKAQSKINQVLGSNCGQTLVDAKRVNVFVKSVKAEKIDNGLVDYTYTAGVEFVGRDNYNSLGYAEVEVVEYQVANPSIDNVEIVSIKGSACK
ncbi:MAG: hypothetical protein ACLGGX_11890 [Bdellovibrionia bacterium]